VIGATLTEWSIILHKVIKRFRVSLISHSVSLNQIKFLIKAK